MWLSRIHVESFKKHERTHFKAYTVQRTGAATAKQQTRPLFETADKNDISKNYKEKQA